MISDFKPQLTDDGSFTFFSEQFGEAFHSDRGAREEAQMKFVEPTGLRQKALQPKLRILDVCYGLGYNTAAALETIWGVNPNCCVEVVALELNPAVPQAAIAHSLLSGYNSYCTQFLTQLAFLGKVRDALLSATLLIGDARATIKLVNESGFQADAIFLDPFSPPKCPQLWTVEFLNLVAKCLHLDGKLATYSSAAAVRTALIAAGLQIASTTPVGRRSPGTLASWIAGDEQVLSDREQEHLLTKAAVPYRDPQLADEAEIIVQRRQQEQSTSFLEPTGQWRSRKPARS